MESSSSEDEYYSADDSGGSEQNEKGSSGLLRKSLERNMAKSQTSKDEDVEFIVKNLDTGESFSSKEIEKKIPKGHTIDPIALDILQRSPKLEEERKEDKRKSKKKWLSKIRSKSHSKSNPGKQDQFAQIARQTIFAHKGAMWVMRFSFAGNYLATGGNDAQIHVWEVDEENEGNLSNEDNFSPPLQDLLTNLSFLVNLYVRTKTTLQISWIWRGPR